MTALFWSMNFGLYSYDMAGQVSQATADSPTPAPCHLRSRLLTHDSLPHAQITKYYGIAESARYMVAVAVAFADAQIAGWDSK